MFTTSIPNQFTRYSIPAIAVLAVIQTVSAQPPVPSNATVYAFGLNGPRGLKFGPDGLLYVAEAGSGGAHTTTSSACAQVVAPFGPYTNGNTARISAIAADGTRTTVAAGFPSGMSSLPSGDTEGGADIAFIGDTLYAVTAGGGCSHGSTIPNGVFQVDRQSGGFTLIANLSDFFQKNPVQHPNADDFEPDGIPYSMIAWNGDLYLIEANHGRLIKVTTSGTITQVTDVSAPLGHVVPTSIVAGGGQFLVGNLGLFPVDLGSSKVYQVALGGCVVGYTPGLTSVTGLALDADGRLYALELSHAAGFPAPGSGRVVRIGAGGLEEIVTGLSVPTGMAFGPDGALYVSDLGAAPPGAGRILRIQAPPPSTTASISPKGLTTLSSEIQLNGAGSTSFDGGPLQYSWSLVRGYGSASITNSNTAKPIVHFASGTGTYAFQLTVSDSKGVTATDTCTINYAGR